MTVALIQAQPQPYILIKDDAEAVEYCAYLMGHSLLALDSETYSNGKRGPEAYYNHPSKKKRRILQFTDPWLNNVRLIQIRSRESESFLFDLTQLGFAGMEALRALLNASGITWILHNAKFDYKMFAINLDVHLKSVYDTMVASKCIGVAIGDQAAMARGHGLKDIVREYLGVKMDKSEQASNWGHPELSAEQLQYASDDLKWLFALYDIFTYTIEHEFGMQGGVAIEMEVLPVVCKMELNGIHLDERMFHKVQAAAAAYLPELEDRICKEIGHPMISTPMPVRLATGRRFMPRPLDMKSGNSPLGSNTYMLKKFREIGMALENLKGDYLEDFFDRFPILKDFVAYKDLSKQLSNNYLDWVHPVTGKIHSEYDQTGTGTARFTCTNPNLQQVSKFDVEVLEPMVEPWIEKYRDKKVNIVKLNYRYCFTAPPGYKFYSADYSGQEVRVMVALSRDPVLIEIHKEPDYVEREGKMVKNMGADIHAKTAELMWGAQYGVTCWNAKTMPFPGMPGKYFRDVAKVIVFGLCYGKTEVGMANDWGITEDEAKAIIRSFFKAYPVLEAWLERQGVIGDETRLCTFGNVGTPFVRIRMLSSSRHTDRGALSRAGKNTPIQGTSALMMKIALIQLDKRFWGTPALTIGSVHDEALITAPADMHDWVSEKIGEAMVAGGDFFLQGIIESKYGLGVDETWSKD